MVRAAGGIYARPYREIATMCCRGEINPALARPRPGRSDILCGRVVQDFVRRREPKAPNSDGCSYRML